MHVARSHLSLDDFLAMEEASPPLEWYRGQVEQKPMPTELHSVLAAALAFLLVQWNRRSRVGRVMVEARTTMRAIDDPRSVVPDLSFNSRERILGPPRHRHLPEAPDLAVEVLSPGQGFGSLQERVAWYLSHGSRLVWVIDGVERSVTVFRRDSPPEVRRRHDSLGDAEVLPGFDATVDDLCDVAELSDLREEQPD